MQVNYNSAALEIDDEFETMRAHKRVTVIWPAVISIKEYQIKCIIYNLSLRGARLKLSMPLAVGAPLNIKIKDFDTIEAVVSYRSKGFIGLNFAEDPEHIKSIFGYYAHKLG